MRDDAKKKAGVPDSLSRKEEKQNKRNTDKKRRQGDRKEIQRSLSEKAVSIAQQRYMGMVASGKIKAPKGLSRAEARKFAKTSHDDLPERVSESMPTFIEFLLMENENYRQQEWQGVASEIAKRTEFRGRVPDHEKGSKGSLADKRPMKSPPTDDEMLAATRERVDSVMREVERLTHTPKRNKLKPSEVEEIGALKAKLDAAFELNDRQNLDPEDILDDIQFILDNTRRYVKR